MPKKIEFVFIKASENESELDNFLKTKPIMTELSFISIISIHININILSLLVI